MCRAVRVGVVAEGVVPQAETMERRDHSGLVKVSHRNCLPDGRRLRRFKFVAADRSLTLLVDHAVYRSSMIGSPKSSYVALQTRHAPSPGVVAYARPSPALRAAFRREHIP